MKFKIKEARVHDLEEQKKKLQEEIMDYKAQIQ